MKKTIHSLIALLMIATFPTVQVQAANLTVESAINQLNYKINVQWDQKDPAFKKAAYQEFTKQIAELQKQGVSNDAIVAALKSKMPDAQTAKDLDTLAAQAKSQGMNSQQVNQLVFQYMQKQATGASWSDEATYAVVAVGVIALVAVILLSGGSVYVDNGYGYSDGYWDSCYDYYYGYYYDCYIYY